MTTPRNPGNITITYNGESLPTDKIDLAEFGRSISEQLGKLQTTTITTDTTTSEPEYSQEERILQYLSLGLPLVGELSISDIRLPVTITMCRPDDD